MQDAILDREHNLKRGKIYYLCSKSIFDELNKKNVPYAVIKGEVLSLLAYNRFGERAYGDIDILVSRNNLNLIERCLHKNYFIQNNRDNIWARERRLFCLSNSHQLPVYRMKIGKGVLEIDLNFDLFWGEYRGKRVEIDEFLQDRILLNIHGCDIWTIPPLKAMVQLLLHHYKDLNSIFILITKNSINFNAFKDVYYLLKNNIKEISIEKLYNICNRYNIISYAFYVLYYTNLIFKDKILEQYVKELWTPKGEELLEYYGLCLEERKKWEVDFYTRLDTKDIYSVIKKDLTEKDLSKLNINMRLFNGEYYDE